MTKPLYALEDKRRLPDGRQGSQKSGDWSQKMPVGLPPVGMDILP